MNIFLKLISFEFHGSKLPNPMVVQVLCEVIVNKGPRLSTMFSAEARCLLHLQRTFQRIVDENIDLDILVKILVLTSSWDFFVFNPAKVKVINKLFIVSNQVLTVNNRILAFYMVRVLSC